MLDDFPEEHSTQRENLILDIVINQPQRVIYDWTELEIEHNNHKAVLYVMKDALKIDGIRVNVTAKTEQKIADHFGASLLTTKICDYIWHKAEERIRPSPQAISSSTKAMIEHSKRVDGQITNQLKLTSTVGKDWVLDNKTYGTNLACNHGWHYDTGLTYQGIKGNVNPSLLKNPKTGQYWYMIQARGTRHDQDHTDYSQVCRLMTRECDIDGKRMDILDVFQNPDLADIVNNDGVLNVTRISGVPKPNTTVIV